MRVVPLRSVCFRGGLDAIRLGIVLSDLDYGVDIPVVIFTNFSFAIVFFSIASASFRYSLSRWIVFLDSNDCLKSASSETLIPNIIKMSIILVPRSPMESDLEPSHHRVREVALVTFAYHQLRFLNTFQQ